MKIKNLEDLEAFMAVAKSKSFTLAAKKLKISVPMLSKKIARIEEAWGTRLFQRTTRSVALTHDGESILSRVSQIWDELESLESTFDSEDEDLKGPVRITAPMVFSQRVLPKVLASFQASYPGISIDLISSDSVLNLVDNHIDIAIRTSAMPDSTLVTKKITTNRVLACAAPEYLKKAPGLKNPSDLKKHSVLFMDVHSGIEFQNSKISLAQLTENRHFTCSDGIVLTRMALQGCGVAIRSEWDVLPYLKTGQLKQVLKDYPLGAAHDVWIMVPSRRHLAPRVRVLMDYLYEHLRN